MPNILVATVLVAHGLITSMIGLGALASPNAPAVSLPAWFAWWPGPFGRSWLFEALTLGGPATTLGGFVWLIGGLLIVAGGLGWFGLGLFEGARVTLLVGGAAVSLVALALYFHPLYVVAIAINLAIVAFLWADFLPARGAP